MKNLENYWTKIWETNRTIFFLFFLFPILTFSQSIIELKNVKGCFVLSENTSLKAAKQGAIEQSKLEALYKGGVAEVISSNQLLHSQKKAFGSQESFYESIQSSLKGEISSYKLIDTKQSVGENGEVIVCAIADVKVLRYANESRNPLSFSVLGVNNKYKSGEFLRAKIEAPTHPYMWVFLVDDNDEYTLLFPSSLQKENKIDISHFEVPNENLEQWKLTAQAKEEKNTLVFVVNSENKVDGLNAITDFNSWANWYTTLDYKTKNIISIPIIIFK